MKLKYRNGGATPPQKPEFDKAFAAAKQAGEETFMFDGKEYTTREYEEFGEVMTDVGGTPVNFMLNPAEVSTDFEPRSKEEQDAYNNLGASGGQRMREHASAVKKDRNQVAEDYLIPALTMMEGGPALGKGMGKLSKILSKKHSPHLQKTSRFDDIMHILQRKFGKRNGGTAPQLEQTTKMQDVMYDMQRKFGNRN